MENKKKKYIIISGFNIHDSNRGTAALGYGSLSFLEQKHGLSENTKIIVLHYVKKIWKKEYKNFKEKVKSQTKEWTVYHLFITEFERFIFEKTGLLLPFSRLRKIIPNVKFVAAINGGDGFSDIYGTTTFHSRLKETLMAISNNIPTIQLPQTMGPFEDTKNYKLAQRIIKGATNLYIRDDKFVQELKKIGVNYTIENDLSYYMHPEPWDINVKNNAIGLNISGLAYSNKFRTLSGQFEQYPALCKAIVSYFQSINCPIYLISHSYNYQNPEKDNDDMVAARDFYQKLENKKDVYLIDKDLNSPQTKFLISKMSFFIGTRMHANFAAIFTKVPLFGLAYSYKFEGAFNKNGIWGQTAMINNIEYNQINNIICQIEKVYKKYIK